jgi:DNA-binding protein HU-beta
MTKAEMIEQVWGEIDGLTRRETAYIVDTVFEALAQSIRDDGRFSYPGFGTFVLKERRARKGRNPQSGDEILIKASKTVAFKAAPALKRRLD